MKIISRFFVIVFCVALLSPCALIARDSEPIQDVISKETAPIITTAPPALETTCAQQVFAGALLADSAAVSEQSPEFEIQAWIYKNFQDPSVVKKVLACPEVSALDEEDNLIVPPIEYQFPVSRKIVVNYETQPKILQQRVLLFGKQPLPCSGDECVSPRVGAPGDPNIWTNTEPAWYGILVVQAGALDAFIGEDKNNTISLKYFEDNFDAIYPKNHNTTKIWQAGGGITAPLCTSVSAFADDNDIVNLAAVKTIGLGNNEEKDTNDYYVAGVASLEWVGWAQVAMDVAITVATVGGGTIVLGATKAVSATRAANELAKLMKELKALDSVKDYEKAINAASKSKNVIKELDAISDVSKLELGKADDLAKILKNSNATERMGQIEKNMRVAEQNLERTKDVKYQYEINRQRNLFKTELETISKTKDAKLTEITRLEKEMAEAEKLGDVKKLKEAQSAFSKLQDLRRGMKAWKIPQRGNVIARTWRAAKALRALNRGEKTISSGAKIGRAGMKSGKIRDWLFQSTLKNVGRLAKMERQAGLLYAALKFGGDMYDMTETSTGEFTSNIKFTPLGLLSADDLTGQENVVNHGMWLLWAGDSVSPADDDAAFLQAMDFANKFNQDMQEVQDAASESGRSAGTMCDVDIFVVRPIIRNPDSDNPELFYLIMNDVPWKVRQ